MPNLIDFINPFESVAGQETQLARLLAMPQDDETVVDAMSEVRRNTARRKQFDAGKTAARGILDGA